MIIGTGLGVHRAFPWIACRAVMVWSDRAEIVLDDEVNVVIERVTGITRGDPPSAPGPTQPKKTSASWKRDSGTVLSSRVASASGTRTISVPCSATITPLSPSCTASMACSPKRVASTRS